MKNSLVILGPMNYIVAQNLEFSCSLRFFLALRLAMRNINGNFRSMSPISACSVYL